MLIAAVCSVVELMDNTTDVICIRVIVVHIAFTLNNVTNTIIYTLHQIGSTLRQNSTAHRLNLSSTNQKEISFSHTPRTFACRQRTAEFLKFKIFVRFEWLFILFLSIRLNTDWRMYATRFSVSIIANLGFIPRHKVYSKWKNRDKRETKNISFIFIKISFKRRNENRKYKKMFTLHKTADFKLASFSKVENVVFCANRGQVSLAGLNFPLSLDVGDVVRPVDEDIVHTRDLTTAAFIQFLNR